MIALYGATLTFLQFILLTVPLSHDLPFLPTMERIQLERPLFHYSLGRHTHDPAIAMSAKLFVVVTNGVESEGHWMNSMT